MTSKNPFGQLSVRRDEEDEVQTVVSQTNVNTNTLPLFNAPVNTVNKKKKVRPDEKKGTEDNNTVSASYEDNTGFEVVGSKKKGPFKGKRELQEEEHAVDGKYKKERQNQGGYLERNDKVAPNKRQFERHSGTGRGKEISKGGAGGHHTWGTNSKNVARDYEKHQNDDNYHDNRENRLFENALNPRVPRQKYEENETQENKTNVEVKDNTENKETTEQVKEENKEANTIEQGQEGTYERKRKEKEVVEVVNEAELIKRPQNALSLADYKEQLKSKNQSLSSVNTNKQVVRNEESNLTLKNKSEEAYLGVESNIKKAEKTNKGKERKENKQEVDLNRLVGSNLKTEDSRDNRDNRNYQGKNYNNKNYGAKKFQFNADDFPEL